MSDQNVAEVIPGAHKAGGHEQGSHDQRWQRELEAYGRQRGRSLRNLPSLIGFAPGIGMRFKALKRWIHRLKQQLSIVYTATADPDMPKYLRWLGVAIVAYSLSPIDLIPDFIPVVGLLDDFIIVPAGIALLIKLTPLEVLHRARALAGHRRHQPDTRIACVLIFLVWCLLILWLIDRFVG